jgi:alkylhydroperoxidase family enzyme
MQTPVQRIPNVPPSDWTGEVRDVFGVEEGMQAMANGSISNAILALANHPDLAIPFLTLHMRFLFLLRATPMLREIVILRVSWLRQTQYEWGHHSLMARAQGVDEAHLEALKAGPEDPIWTAAERAALRVVDEFCNTARVGDEAWAELNRHLGRKEVMELLFLAGQYEMVCRTFNAMRIEIEPAYWNPSLPGA